MARSPRLAVTPALVVALTGCVLLADGLQAQSRAAALQVAPDTVEVGTFFHGLEIHVSGDLPAGYEVAILLDGGERDLQLRKKGKVLGLLWMTVGVVEFHHVPEIYLLATSAPLADLASPRMLEELGVGLDALASSFTLSPPEEDRTALARELVKLRADEGLFGAAEGSVTVAPGRGRSDTADALFRLPARVKEGTYQVRLLGFRDGSATTLATVPLTVRRVGLTRTIGDLARRSGLLYGILAVVAALGMGLLTGALFGRGAGKGH